MDIKIKNVFNRIENYLCEKVDVSFKAFNGVSLYYLFFSVASWVFIYSYTKSYFKSFGYNYFRENSYESMYLFFHNSMELFSDFIPISIMILFVFTGLIAYIEYVNYEKEKPLSITRLSICMLLLSISVMLFQFLYVINELVDIQSVFKLVLINVGIILSLLFLLKERYFVVSIFVGVFFLIVIFIDGEKLGEFMAIDTQLKDEKVELRTDKGVRINFQDGVRGESRIKKYLIGNNNSRRFFCVDSLISKDTINNKIIERKIFKVSSIDEKNIKELTFLSTIKKVEAINN